ncbi:MAG: hypothetical protein KF846_04620 [Cyclobacteriaceae bacterium]|nr:hypothetical protein [Cyclobacteriaceae bacterium]
MTKKVIIVAFLSMTTLVVGYKLYKQYAPFVIANAILKEEEPIFLPPKIKKKLKEKKVHYNKISKDVIQDIHKSNITLDQVLKALDEVTEEKVYLFLDEVNGLGEIKSSDQIFDLTKKYFPVDFDVEPLRKPFEEKADIVLLQKVIKKANEYRDNELIDFQSAKIVIKRILIEKEKEFIQNLNPE